MAASPVAVHALQRELDGRAARRLRAAGGAVRHRDARDVAANGGLGNDAEDILRGEREDGQPVEPFPTRFAVAVVAFPGHAFGPRGALVAAQSDSADQAAFEPWMSADIAAKLAFDWRNLKIAPAPSSCGIRPLAPLFDAFEERFSGGDAGQNERHARRHRVLDVSNGSLPQSTSPSGAWTMRSCSRGTMRDSRIVIAWLSLPPLLDIATSAPRSISSRHSGGNGNVGTAAKRRQAAHASRPSWSVSFMSGVTLTNSGETTYSGSLPSSAGGHLLTVTMAAAGSVPRKHEKSAKLSCLAPRQGFEDAAVFFGDVGGHGGDPRLDSALRGSGAVASRGHTGLDWPEPAAPPGGGIRGGWQGGF